MSVLTMDLNQQLTQFAQLDRGTAVPLIKPRERPSLLITDEANIHARLQAGFLPASAGRWRIFQRKTGAQVGTSSAGTTMSASARPPRQRPRASIAIDYPRRSRQLLRSCRYENQSQVTNDSKVADGQLCQHSCFPVEKPLLLLCTV